MRKLIPVYVRIPLLYVIFFGLTEYFIDSGDKPAFIKFPSVALMHLVFIFILIAAELVMNAVDKVIYHLMTKEEQNAHDVEMKKPVFETDVFKKLRFKLTDLKPIDQEKDLELHHDYDGIKELDNGLPPWFTGLFYATILFAMVYLVRFHVMGDYNQDQEFENEMKVAKAQVDEYMKTAPDLMSKDKVTLLTDATAIAEGKTIFEQNCVACHRADAGGQIGPNLTDVNWILGGGIKNVFNTISEGGREGKGMIPWKETLKPTQIQKVASYVLSLQGTSPKNPKASEGDVWKEDASADVKNDSSNAEKTTQKDSLVK